MASLLVTARRFGPYRSFADLLSRSPRLRLWLVAAVPLVWVIVADIAPLWRMLVISFYETYPLPASETPRLTLEHYRVVFDRPLYLSAFVRTLVFGGLATALTLLIMFPVAFFISKGAPQNRRLRLLLLVISPFWVSEVTRSFAWMLMLSNGGAVNGFLSWLGLIEQPVPMLYTGFSLTIGVLYLTSLYMLLPLYAALEKIDDSLLQAAADLGASNWMILRRIVLPLAREGVVSGCSLVFLITTGLYALPQLLGGPSNTLFASLIAQVFAKAGDSWPLGAALSVMLVVSCLLVVAVFVLVVGSQRRVRR